MPVVSGDALSSRAITAPHTRPLLLPGPTLRGGTPPPPWVPPHPSLASLSDMSVIGSLAMPPRTAFALRAGRLCQAMLSYQHAYHAGNLADLHKHALLATALDYLTRKDKPLSYLETHAGRGLYHLDSAESRKTREARAGIERALAEGWLAPDHPLSRALAWTRARHGATAYPGSPLIAQHFLRADDRAHLAELHPAEYEALSRVAGFARLYRQDGIQMAQAVCPPTPRRGMLLMDPSYEVKSDYVTLPRVIAEIARKWNVGVLALWYPILTDNRHLAMTASLTARHPDALLSEVRFAPARPGHAMVGSGMFVVNPPWGLEGESQRLQAIFRSLA